MGHTEYALRLENNILLYTKFIQKNIFHKK